VSTLLIKRDLPYPTLIAVHVISMIDSDVELPELPPLGALVGPV
jgi:hypothetical protein